MTAWGRRRRSVVASRVARLFPAYWVARAAHRRACCWWSGPRARTSPRDQVARQPHDGAVAVRRRPRRRRLLDPVDRAAVLRPHPRALSLVGITRRRVVGVRDRVAAASRSSPSAVGRAGWLRTLLVAAATRRCSRPGWLLYVVHRDGSHAAGCWAAGRRRTPPLAVVRSCVPDQREQQCAQRPPSRPSAVGARGRSSSACVAAGGGGRR